MRSLKRLIALGLFALLCGSASGQAPQSTFQIIFQPAKPAPTDVVRVFIRTIAPANPGLVLCPAAGMTIFGTSITGQSVLLRVLNQGVPGGVPVPFCDGNTVQFGPLPAGQYTVSASIILGDGTVLPAFATAQLTVGAAAANAVPIPAWSPLTALIAALVSVGFAGRVLERRRRLE